MANVTKIKMNPSMTTINFIPNVAFSSDMERFENGRMKSKNITPAIEFKAVDTVLKRINNLIIILMTIANRVG